MLTEHQLCDDAPSSGIDDQIIDGSMIKIGGSIDGIFVTKTIDQIDGEMSTDVLNWPWSLPMYGLLVHDVTPSRGSWSNQYDTMKGCPNLSRAPVIDCQEETLNLWEAA